MVGFSESRTLENDISKGIVTIFERLPLENDGPWGMLAFS